ncbi:hypothetical protein EVAR_46819_1 [Eumeta japonica]|uniref:Uncharacterized protein n=1 Tax=Eumeta variegata TaxID=151549 RepID=A0A4C1ZMK8_EUMVA|nr:hypothetical protein EVAR_46819_1 [Eumeta japonica]
MEAMRRREACDVTRGVTMRRDNRFGTPFLISSDILFFYYKADYALVTPPEIKSEGPFKSGKIYQNLQGHVKYPGLDQRKKHELTSTSSGKLTLSCGMLYVPYVA